MYRIERSAAEPISYAPAGLRPLCFPPAKVGVLARADVDYPGLDSVARCCWSPAFGHGTQRHAACRQAIVSRVAPSFHVTGGVYPWTFTPAARNPATPTALPSPFR
jgi:hypothetical protein